MPHFCMFGATEVQLEAEPTWCVTFFGGLDLRRPPLAQLITARRQIERAPGKPRYHWVLTLCGGTDVRWPTLAEEYAALKNAVTAGTLSLAEWDRTVASSDVGASAGIRSFTAFGGLSADEIPTEDQEVESLSMQRHFGHIPQRAAEILMLAIGQRSATRLAAVRRAVAHALSAEAGGG